MRALLGVPALTGLLLATLFTAMMWSHIHAGQRVAAASHGASRADPDLSVSASRPVLADEAAAIWADVVASAGDTTIISQPVDAPGIWIHDPQARLVFAEARAGWRELGDDGAIVREGSPFQTGATVAGKPLRIVAVSPDARLGADFAAPLKTSHAVVGRLLLAGGNQETAAAIAGVLQQHGLAVSVGTVGDSFDTGADALLLSLAALSVAVSVGLAAQASRRRALVHMACGATAWQFAGREARVAAPAALIMAALGWGAVGLGMRWLFSLAAPVLTLLAIVVAAGIGLLATWCGGFLASRRSTG